MTVKNVPSELAALDQWVIWHLMTRKGKATKVPHRAFDGKQASTTTPGDWSSLEDALVGAQQFGADGVGFVFSADDPYCGIDLDHCVDESGDIHPDAYALIQRLDTYSEISPSGTGVHVIGIATLDAGRRTKNTPWGGNLEAYDQGRYFTFTGKALNGLAIKEVSGTLDFTGPEDQKLIDRCRRNSKGFAALFDEGDVSEYDDDRSKADLALANMVAARTDDAKQIERIMRQSALVREKWDTPDTGSVWLIRRCIEPALRDKGSQGGSGGSQWTWDEDQDVERQLYMMRVRDRAKQAYQEEQAKTREFQYPLPEWSLEDELALPPRENVWRVEGLQRVHGNVVLIAGYKLGKTTLVMNLIRSLADGTPFLGFDVRPVEGNIAVFNYELDSEQWVDWARDMRIQSPNKVKPVHLRGLGSLQFWVPAVQDRLVGWMLANNIRYWVLDPTAQAWSSLLESEGDNINADRFTKAIDMVKDRAGIDETNLTHHTSRDPQAQDKGRGPSALEGWYDAGWFLIGKRDALVFKAIGRDVDVAELNIAYQEDRARSFIVDVGPQKVAVQESRMMREVALEILDEEGPLSLSKLGALLKERDFGMGHTGLRDTLLRWSKDADNPMRSVEQRVHGRKQLTFYIRGQEHLLEQL